MKIGKTILSAVALIALVGCGTDYRAVPSGYAGKLLTPTGFQEKLHTSGQVDIGTKNSNGSSNALVLIENTSITVKESFLGAASSEDKTDHRLVTKDDMIPFSVDVRLSFMSPDFSKKESEKLFTLVTPEPYENENRIKVIRLEKVYKTLAKMEVRTAIRKAFDEHGKNYKDVMQKRNEIDAQIAKAVIAAIADSGCPLQVKSVDLSMLMPDESIWKAAAVIQTAEAQVKSMQRLASEIQALPNGLEIYRLIMMKEVVEIGSKNGTNTIVWPIGGTPILPLKPKE